MKPNYGEIYNQESIIKCYFRKRRQGDVKFVWSARNSEVEN